MGRTIAELTHDMTSEEFSVWQQLYEEDRFGEALTEKREDFRAGSICATLVNWAGKSLSQGSPPLKPEDFMPSLAKKEEVSEVVTTSPDPIAHFQAVAKILAS